MTLLSYRYLPLNLYIAYAAFVIGSLILGPVTYQGLDYWVLLPYLSGFLLLFAVGYLRGSRSQFRYAREERFAHAHTCYLAARTVFSGFLVWAMVSSLIGWYQLLSSGVSLSFSSLGESYAHGYEDYVRGAASIDAAYVFGIFDQTAVTLALILGIANFSCLDRPRRAMLVFVVLSYVLINLLGAGKQKYLGDIVIFVSAAAVINAAANYRRVRVRTLAWTTLAALVAFAAFCEILRQRYVTAGTGLENIGFKGHPLVSWDVDSFVLNVFGPEYGFAIGVFLSYFSNGLYGLYLSLTLPFEWTFFVGSSYSVGRIVEIALSQDGLVLGRTYPYRVGEAYGWGFDKWHSAFAWLASDLSFTGVLVLTPIFAAFFARLWRESVNSTNPYAAPLFIYLSLGLAFSFANNQLVHSLAGVIVLIFLVVQWRRHNVKQRRAQRRAKRVLQQSQLSPLGLPTHRK